MMNILFLAPDIQASLLESQAVDGVEPKVPCGR
jgi:hypothetical protein